VVASLPKVYPEVYQKVYPEVYQKCCWSAHYAFVRLVFVTVCSYLFRFVDICSSLFIYFSYWLVLVDICRPRSDRPGSNCPGGDRPGSDYLGRNRPGSDRPVVISLPISALSPDYLGAISRPSKIQGTVVTYIYIYIYMCTYTHIYIYIYTDTHMYIHDKFCT